MSTNVLFKAGFDLFLTGSARSRKIAASAGYVITELVKKNPILQRRVWDRIG
jgi:hypothetical protein